jgi:hypothetical protein
LIFLTINSSSSSHIFRTLTPYLQSYKPSSLSLHFFVSTTTTNFEAKPLATSLQTLSLSSNNYHHHALPTSRRGRSVDILQHGRSTHGTALGSRLATLEALQDPTPLSKRCRTKHPSRHIRPHFQARRCNRFILSNGLYRCCQRMWGAIWRLYTRLSWRETYFDTTTVSFRDRWVDTCY